MNILELARQAGFITDFGCRETASDELLTRFAALVRNATLEEAAKCSRDTVTACPVAAAGFASTNF